MRGRRLIASALTVKPGGACRPWVFAEQPAVRRRLAAQMGRTNSVCPPRLAGLQGASLKGPVLGNFDGEVKPLLAAGRQSIEFTLSHSAKVNDVLLHLPKAPPGAGLLVQLFCKGLALAAPPSPLRGAWHLHSSRCVSRSSRSRTTPCEASTRPKKKLSSLIAAASNEPAGPVKDRQQACRRPSSTTAPYKRSL